MPNPIRNPRRAPFLEPRAKSLLPAMLALAALCCVYSVEAASYGLAPYLPYTESDPSMPDAVAIGDVTGDGRDDAVLVTSGHFVDPPTNDYSVFIYPQTKNGFSGTPVRLPYLGTQDWGRVRVDVADLNNDGTKDVIVGYDEGVTVLIARGNGLFTTNKIAISGLQMSAMTVVDVTSDGKADILWQNYDGALSILPGKGDGSFLPTRVVSANSAWNQAFVVADVTNDSIPDLVFSNQLSLTVYPGAGNGNFLPARTYAYPRADARGFNGLTVLDVNHDGRNDILASTSGNPPNALIWTYLQATNGTLSVPSSFQTYDIPEVLKAADLDRDGYQDLLVMHSGWSVLGFYLQNRNGWSTEYGANVEYATHFNKDGVATGDLNGDGCTDVATANYNYGLLVLPGVNCYEPWRLIRQGGGDFDGDGRSDILWHDVADGTNVIWKSGDINQQIPVTRITDPNWVIAGVGDFNDDGKSDILWRHLLSGKNAIWLSGQSTSPVTLQPIQGNAWEIVGIGDFDGNGKDDILWHNKYTGASALWPDGNYASGKALTTITDTDWIVVGVGDFNGDARSDVLWRNRRTGENAIWLEANYKNGQPVATISDPGWQVAGVDDFNDDGRSDILWHYAYTGQNTIWYSAVSSTSTSITKTSIAWKIAGTGDFDHDGYADILWRQNQTGANAIWRSGNSSTPITVTGITNMSWKAI